MIATWMLAATLFTGLLGIAAVAAERALRTLVRQARGPWLAALAAAVTWQVIAPVAAAFFATPSSRTAPSAVPAARSAIGTITANLPALPRAWAADVDAALIALWALASLVLFVRLARAMRALSRVERSAASDVIEGVAVLLTPSIGPAVFGTRRLRVLVPRWLFDLDAPLRALVLRHEQEHCRARDPQVTLAAAVAVALVPWNAAVWWLARRLRLALELDCDARVLRADQDPERYGRLLLFIAQRQSQTRLAPMLAESNSHLSRRITAMNAPRPANPRTRAAFLLLVAAGALGWSATYAAALSTPPSMPLGALTSLASRPQGGDTTCLLGPPVAHAPNSAVPRYPDILRSAGVEGDVLAMFVVDTMGRADPASFKVLNSTHQLFTLAVKNSLPDMNFVPAEVRGRKVKQLVQLPVYFYVSGSAASASSTAPGAGSCSSPDSRGVWTLPSIQITVPK
jgi:beta-lactamase regulating signal transducer with metallopeptidase domain